MKKGKKPPPKATHAKAGNPTPATLAEKNAAEHRRGIAEFKKKQKAKKAERDREFAELPDELKNIHSNLKFADLDIYPDGEAERLAVDFADLMFRPVLPPHLHRNGNLDMMEAAAQRGLFMTWAADPNAWRTHLDMAKTGGFASHVARTFLDMKAKQKHAFATAFKDTLARCILSDGSFDPPSDQMRRFVVAQEYWKCVRKHGRNVRRVEFCKWLRAIAARVEKDGRGDFYGELAKAFEPRGQGRTRYAKDAGITFVEKRGFRLGGK
jgi:hypothetical protein